VRARHPDHIARAHDTHFDLAGSLRRSGEACTILELGKALLAQIVQIDRIEDDERSLCGCAELGQVLRRKVCAAEDRHVEFGAMPFKKSDLRPAIENLDAELLQLRCIRLETREVVREERHPKAQFDQYPEQSLHPQGAGILVVMRHHVVHDEQPFASPAIPRRT